jgi:hypothetical protein
MIALLLGIVLTFAAVNLFLHSKISYLEDEEYGRLQENGRYALRLVGRELSMAGFLGGVFRGENITTPIPVTAGSCLEYMLDTSVPFVHQDNVDEDGINQFNDADHPVIPAECRTAGKHEPDTDMLVSRRTADRAHVLEGTLDPGLSIDNSDIYLRRQEYNVSLTLVTGDQANYSGQVVDVWEYDPQVLFIRNWSRQDGDGVPALCRKRLPSLTTECLVEGVENMQLEFGIDDDGDFRADRFDPAPSKDEIEDAVAVRIYLLLRSVNPVTGYTNDRSFTLGSTAVAAANDNFYRRVFQTTVLLRNSEVYKY